MHYIYVYDEKLNHFTQQYCDKGMLHIFKKYFKRNGFSIW